MGDQGAENNELQKMEKRVEKKLKKGKTGKESVTGLLEVDNFGRNEPSKHEKRSTIEDISEMSRNHRKNKKKKAKEVTDAEVVDVEKDSSYGQRISVDGEDGSGVARNHEKRKKKKSKNEASYLHSYEVGKLEANEVLEMRVEEKVSELKSGKTTKKERKKQVMEIHDFGDTSRVYENREHGGTFDDNIEECVTENVKGKKRKRGRTSKDDNCIESQGNGSGATESKIYDGSEENMAVENKNKSKKIYESISEDLNNDISKRVKRKKKNAAEDEHDEGGHVEKHKRRKRKNKTYGNEVEEANKSENEKAKLVVNDLDDPTPSKSNKKVSFSGHVEVFPLSDDSNTKEIYDEENLVQGKRFTPQEDEIVKTAVYRFIEDHNLGENGLDMVLNSRNHPELKGCWKEIGAAIHYRPYTAVYCRAQVIFRRSTIRKWTQEEYDRILEYQELNGNEWRALADELGKHRWHVKDTWRRIKLPNMNKGHWTQKEYQNLFDLVNIDLQQKLSEEKRSKHGMLRDNICWTAISDKLATRSLSTCCRKWYKQLTSPMVIEGLWTDTDDYRMLQKLYSMDAGCREDVDWDTLLDHRSGDLCRKRWNQMVMHIDHHGTKQFSEQVDLLAQRYCPELLEARKIWDGKPRVP